MNLTVFIEAAQFNTWNEGNTKAVSSFLSFIQSISSVVIGQAKCLDASFFGESQEFSG